MHICKHHENMQWKGCAVDDVAKTWDKKKKSFMWEKLHKHKYISWWWTHIHRLPVCQAHSLYCYIIWIQNIYNI